MPRKIYCGYVINGWKMHEAIHQGRSTKYRASCIVCSQQRTGTIASFVKESCVHVFKDDVEEFELMLRHQRDVIQLEKMTEASIMRRFASYLEKSMSDLDKSLIESIRPSRNFEETMNQYTSDDIDRMNDAMKKLMGDSISKFKIEYRACVGMLDDVHRATHAYIYKPYSNLLFIVSIPSREMTNNEREWKYYLDKIDYEKNPSNPSKVSVCKSYFAKDIKDSLEKEISEYLKKSK